MTRTYSLTLGELISTMYEEFMDIYKLDVLEIPTNVAVARKDEDDEVYRTAKEKYEAIASDHHVVEFMTIYGDEELASVAVAAVINDLLSSEVEPERQDLAA